jgi:hypothetical protein
VKEGIRIKPSQIVLVDSTVIIEAYKLSCWNALAKRYRLEMVDRCLEECATGDPLRSDYVPIDVSTLARDIRTYAVTGEAMAGAALVSADFHLLHSGEKELMAHCLSRIEEAWLVSSQDRACLRVGYELGFSDRFISLEELLQSLSIKIKLRPQFTKAWLVMVRTNLKLGLE